LTEQALLEAIKSADRFVQQFRHIAQDISGKKTVHSIALPNNAGAIRIVSGYQIIIVKKINDQTNIPNLALELIYTFKCALLFLALHSVEVNK